MIDADAKSGKPPPSVEGRFTRHLIWVLCGIGVIGVLVATAGSPSNAQHAASQDWPPFVLVTGLLLIGLVAADDGLFAAAGYQLARVAKNGVALFFCATFMIGLVTAVLNLDTSVAFLTPVLVYAARSRGENEAPFLYACLLLSNAGSLFLTGSNLTNLIVLNHSNLNGAKFFTHTWAAAFAALLVTAIVVGLFHRRELKFTAEKLTHQERPVLGLGLLSVITATVLVLALRSPALPVAILGVLVVSFRLIAHKDRLGRVLSLLSLPTLVGLLGVSVTFGTLGRTWSDPATLLSHLNLWGTVAVAGIASALINNLPAASLLAAHAPRHPFALLVGLNLGPNLFVTGSLAWLLWLQAARTTGARPSINHATRIGMVAVPLSVVCAIGLLLITP